MALPTREDTAAMTTEIPKIHGYGLQDRRDGNIAWTCFGPDSLGRAVYAAQASPLTGYLSVVALDAHGRSIGMVGR